MAHKLFAKADLTVVRHQYRGNKRLIESQNVLNLVGERGQKLYEYFAYQTLYDSDDLGDTAIGHLFDWVPSLVSMIKRKLVDNDLISITEFRNERLNQSVYRLVVGEDLVKTYR